MAQTASHRTLGVLLFQRHSRVFPTVAEEC